MIPYKSASPTLRHTEDASISDAKWSLWRTVFGPHDNAADILRECEEQSVDPQDYAMSAIREAIDQGAILDPDEALKGICLLLGVTTP